MAEIFDVMGMGMSIRHSEYKDITSAISELVDNSIEANATKIYIILDCIVDHKKTNGKEKVENIYILDNGSGMDKKEVENCLSFGKGSNENATYMSKFGVGLSQASLFAAPMVRVYSWKDNYNDAYSTYLSANEMRTGKQTKIDIATRCTIPEKIKENLSNKEDFLFHGTLVEWSGVDNIKFKRTSTIIDKILIELGQRFRLYLEDNVEIIVYALGSGCKKENKVKIIDPLFLSAKSKELIFNAEVVGEESFKYEFAEPFFEPFEEWTYSVEYNGKKGDVKIVTSIIKEKFYYNEHYLKKGQFPGDTDIGKIVKEYEGISFIRSNREIEFGRFNLYKNVNTPTHRWWGMNIYFGPELDDFFGVSNNKQHVEIPTDRRNDINISDASDEPYDKHWLNIIEYIETTIKMMKGRNSRLQKEYKVRMEAFDNGELEKGNQIEDVVDENTTASNTNIIKDDENELRTLLFDKQITKGDNEDKTKLFNSDNVEYIDNGSKGEFIWYEFSNGKYKFYINKKINESVNEELANKKTVALFNLILDSFAVSCNDNISISSMDIVKEFIDYINKKVYEVI